MENTITNKETENLILSKGPKGKRYIMKLAEGQYLGYPKNTDPEKEENMIIVDNENDAVLINRSTKSLAEDGYYTWAFYPHGDKKKGKRIDYRLRNGIRRIFGNNNDSLAVSWKPEHENGGKFYAVAPKVPEALHPRLGNKGENLIAAAKGGYEIELIERK
ncbi:conserved hypothetical protein [Tenacibaculum sp. 190524A02b]|uniref:Uncharacterized protein n=1 Tax=Tenacibaculum vairaonense TaxID=3137860 RepID=A0ABM9PL39_9FLAO